ncbi:MAG TPA: hypothetical protein VJ867_00830 [Gemmatimonadaceae bacterium]|nr:hypothetical protein [Gemmatimonadaceae bacterium]
MRASSLIALSLVVVPAALSAQRIPFRIGGRHPGGPTNLPPTAAPIARELAYKRLNVSIESYPMVSHFDVPGFMTGGAPSHWTSAGMGSRVDYRVTSVMSATLDMTSTFLGGPANTFSAELGTRFRAPRDGHRLMPFIDLRGGYFATYDMSLNPIDETYAPPGTAAYGPGAHYTTGLGAIAGTGLEYALSRQFSLMTSVSGVRGYLKPYDLGSGFGTRSTYPMTSIRYTIGLRFNPVRTLAAQADPRM